MKKQTCVDNAEYCSVLQNSSVFTGKLNSYLNQCSDNFRTESPAMQFSRCLTSQRSLLELDWAPLTIQIFARTNNFILFVQSFFILVVSGIVRIVFRAAIIWLRVSEINSSTVMSFLVLIGGNTL